MRALRSILGIRWQDCVTNLEVLDRANSTSIESLLKAQLRWAGHVIPLDDRIPRPFLYWELTHGKRNQGRPKKRYKDTVKANIQWCQRKPKELEESASNRTLWRSRTFKAATYFEKARRQKLIAARNQRNRAAAAVITTTGFQCL